MLGGSVVNSMLWNGLQRFGGMGITFITNLILARLLSPHEFGIVGVILIFISICETFVDGGLGAALIQKQNVTDKDYQTVFSTNIVVSIFFYILIFIISGEIASYFKIEELSTVLKIQGIVIIINAFAIIQTNMLVKSIAFKKLAKINLLAVVASNILVIVLAYKGFGFWSIIAKNIFFSACNVFLLWIYSKWRPKFQFDTTSFRELYRFGAFILLSNLIEKIYDNFQSFIIGRHFSTVKLGFYTQAYRLQELPAFSISGVVNQVTFPIFSKIQNDYNLLKKQFINNLVLISYINVALFIYLYFVAESLIPFLFSDKWLESADMFKVLCLSGMIYPINTIHTNIIKSLGKSNVFFVQQLVKRIIGVIIIIISIPFGLDAVVISVVISSYLFLLINMYITKIYLKYRIYHQLKDQANNILVFTLSSIIIYFLKNYIGFEVYLVDIISKSVLVFGVYIFSSMLFSNKSFYSLKGFVIKYLKQR